MRQKRLQRVALGLAIILALWTVFFVYKFAWGQYHNILVDLNVLPNAYGFDPSALPADQRRLLFLVWMPPILLATIGFLFGAYAAFNVARGRIFDATALWPVMAVGVTTCLSIGANNLAYNYEIRTLLSLTDRASSRHFWYWTPVEITVFLFGLGFILLGWIHREVILIAQENKAFV